MSNIWSDVQVKYQCSCGSLYGISKLLFCRHCEEIKCGTCVSQEVESYFCSSCLEHIPSAEARHKKNSCPNCLQCPCCKNTLSARATAPLARKSTEAAKDPAALSTKKVYYLSCTVCRWTSRDIGIPDQSTASGVWPEADCHFQMKFDLLLEHYQELVLYEKSEKQDFSRKKCQKASKFPCLADRSNTTASIIRRRIGWPVKALPKDKISEITPSEAITDVGKLSEDLITKDVNASMQTTLSQRIDQLVNQPTMVNQLYPQRRSLCVKRSLRCSQCEHNLIKPEYLPTSTKYRINLFASHHVPIIAFLRCEENLYINEPNFILLRVINPTTNDIKLSFGRLDNSNIFDAFIHSISDPDVVNTPFVLQKRDDSIDFEDEEGANLADPSIVISRKSNKAIVRLPFTPDSSLKKNEAVIFCTSMSYNPLNSEGNRFTKIFINAGTVQTKEQ